MIERALGEEIPVSIGTALAMENAIVTDLPKPNYVYFNFRTLFRNFYESFPKDASIRPEEGYAAFEEEINTILNLCRNQRLEPHLYVLQYKFPPPLNHAKKKFPWVRGKEEPGTQRQMDYAMGEEQFLNWGLHNPNLPLEIGEHKITALKAPCWILTHMMADLIYLPYSSNISLLESYTGVVKQSRQWFGKLSKQEDIQQFPFNTFTLQVYGDGVMFKAARIKVKRVITELGLQRNWNILTTITTIRNDIRRSQMDQALKDECLSFI